MPLTTRTETDSSVQPSAVPFAASCLDIAPDIHSAVAQKYSYIFSDCLKRPS